MSKKNAKAAQVPTHRIVTRDVVAERKRGHAAITPSPARTKRKR